MPTLSSIGATPTAHRGPGYCNAHGCQSMCIVIRVCGPAVSNTRVLLPCLVAPRAHQTSYLYFFQE